jgi:hypothetical protein
MNTPGSPDREVFFNSPGPSLGYRAIYHRSFRALIRYCKLGVVWDAGTAEGDFFIIIREDNEIVFSANS